MGTGWTHSVAALYRAGIAGNGPAARNHHLCCAGGDYQCEEPGCCWHRSFESNGLISWFGRPDYHAGPGAWRSPVRNQSCTYAGVQNHLWHWRKYTEESTAGDHDGNDGNRWPFGDHGRRSCNYRTDRQSDCRSRGVDSSRGCSTVPVGW